MVNEKLNLVLSNTYTTSRTDMNDPNFANTSLSSNYDYDLSDIEQYSDLDISQIEISANAAYMFNDNVSLNLGFTYLRYDDDEPYLEDGTGEAYITNFSVSYFF